MALNKRNIGSEKERIAGQYLEEKGFTLLEYNYRTRMSEIDIVARDKGVLVFVEVKYRKDLSDGHPLEAVTPQKQRRIRNAALCYLEDHELFPDQTAIRFDVVGILGDEISHITDAF